MNQLKTLSRLITVAALVAGLPIAGSSFAAILFSEDFSNGLGKWKGKNRTPFGVIVPDPLASGRAGVVTFTNTQSGGDIFTTDAFQLTGKFTVAFDYLGLPRPGSVTNDLGGFVGISTNFTQPVPDWLAGTQLSFPGLRVFLVTNGVWQRYTVTLTNFTPTSFWLTLEDYRGSLGVPGDVFFDNIEIATLPSMAPSLHIANDASNNLCNIDVMGSVGALYRVEYSATLPTTNWITLGKIVLPSSPYLLIDTQLVTSVLSRFYRAIAVD